MNKKIPDYIPINTDMENQPIATFQASILHRITKCEYNNTCQNSAQSGLAKLLYNDRKLSPAIF